MLSDEVGLMLADFYLDDLTISEICLAVRLNSWPLIKYPGGKDIEKVPIPQKLNVDFLMKILYNYKILRDYMEKEFAKVFLEFIRFIFDLKSMTKERRSVYPLVKTFDA